jgi:hypothetical protein
VKKSREANQRAFITLLRKNETNLAGIFDASTANWLKITFSTIRARAGTGSGRIGDSDNLSNVFGDGPRHPTPTDTLFDPMGFV